MYVCYLKNARVFCKVDNRVSAWVYLILNLKKRLGENVSFSKVLN
jgi:hypothetical protein